MLSNLLALLPPDPCLSVSCPPGFRQGSLSYPWLKYKLFRVGHFLKFPVRAWRLLKRPLDCADVPVSPIAASLLLYDIIMLELGVPAWPMKPQQFKWTFLPWLMLFPTFVQTAECKLYAFLHLYMDSWLENHTEMECTVTALTTANLSNLNEPSATCWGAVKEEAFTHVKSPEITL